MRRGLINLLAWGGFGLLAWGAWLAFPRVPGVEPGPGLRAVIVDASASAVRRRPGWGARVREVVREEGRGAKAADEELTVVLAGRDVLRLRAEDFVAGVGWLDPAFDQAGFGAGTELDAAISSVETELMDPTRMAGRLVIVGDGEWTSEDPRPRLARLARAGVECSRTGVGAARWPDLGIHGVRLPVSLTQGEPLAVVCELAYQPGETEVSGELVVECKDASGLRRVTEPLALPAGAGSWSVSVHLGPCADGEVQVDARVRLSGAGALSAGDPVGENDQAGGRTRSGELLLGLAAAEKGKQAELQAWLDASGGGGIQWEFVLPHEVAERLPGRDLLISYDVSTAALPEEWIGPFLERGGGWLAVGGWGLLAEFWPRGMGGSAPASEWLPLVPAPSDSPEREVVFCVDGSGSMSGEPFESVRGALLQLVRATLPSDQLQMRFFTAALGPVIDVGGGGGGGRLQGLRKLLDARVPGGSTDILASMETLAKARKKSEVPGLVLLLSDGRDDSAFQIKERSAALRRSFTESRTRLSVIGIGSESDLELLAELAGGEAEVVVVEELEKLVDLFRREVARERVREGEPVGVTVHGGAQIEDVEALVKAWGARSEWPEVERLARMEARPGANVVLRSAEDLPVMGLGRVGEGWAAAFPGLMAEGWAPGFAGAADVWLPLWRLLGRGGAPAEGAPRIEARGDQLLLTLGSAGESWPAEVKVELRGRDADGLDRVLGSASMALGGGGVPGVMGRRVGELGVLVSGGGRRWRAHLSDPSSGEELAVLPFERPLGAEFRPFSGTLLGLGPLEDAGGQHARSGQVVPDERAPTVIGAALLLLAMAAFAGRWGG